MTWTVLPGFLGNASLALQVKNEYKSSQKPPANIPPVTGPRPAASWFGGLKHTRRAKRKTRRAR